MNKDKEDQWLKLRSYTVIDGGAVIATFMLLSKSTLFILYHNKPFAFEIVGSILATDSCKNSQSTLCESRGFSLGVPVFSHRKVDKMG
jgi:hypothetical protein